MHIPSGNRRDAGAPDAQLDEWLAKIANVRVHGTTQKIVAEAFPATQPSYALKPLEVYNRTQTCTEKRRGANSWKAGELPLTRQEQ